MATKRRKKPAEMTSSVKSLVRLLVGSERVSTRDSEVRAKFRKKCAKYVAKGAVDDCAEYAVAEHQANRGLYMDVMSGRLGRNTGRVPLDGVQGHARRRPKRAAMTSLGCGCSRS